MDFSPSGWCVMRVTRLERKPIFLSLKMLHEVSKLVYFIYYFIYLPNTWIHSAQGLQDEWVNISWDGFDFSRASYQGLIDWILENICNKNVVRYSFNRHLHFISNPKNKKILVLTWFLWISSICVVIKHGCSLCHLSYYPILLPAYHNSWWLLNV